MKNLEPLDFQREAIDELIKIFLDNWKSEDRQVQILLKSPTASGKTVIATNFIIGLNNLPMWDIDKAFIWITFGDELVNQSKQKFRKYQQGNNLNKLLDVRNIPQGKLRKNDILFINWEKIVAKNAKNKNLRRPNDKNFYAENTVYFEDFIDNTHKENREIILVIDEVHRNASTKLSKEIIDYINPKIILSFSATPTEQLYFNCKMKNTLCEVNRAKVVDQGLIKERVVVQSKEILKEYQNEDLDEVLLKLAIEKKEDLQNQYMIANKKINPLVLIQLPNDDNRLVDIGEKKKEQVVLDYLSRCGVPEHKIAYWYDGRTKGMECIEENDSEIDYMIFKQAAGTGWDCPRAHILVMYREITSSIFYEQTVGRILRMADPQDKKYAINNPDLKTGFLFTNYKKDEIKLPDQDNKNKISIYESKRKLNISNVKIKSDYISRVDYGDLSNPEKFQKCFRKSMDEFFELDSNLSMEQRRSVLSKSLNFDVKVTSKVITDAKLENFDSLSLELMSKVEGYDFEMSHNDVEKCFNYYCYKLLKEQTDEEAKISNISRSWNKLKSAIRLWMSESVSKDSDKNYRIFINDINKNEASRFRRAITKAIKDYKPIMKQDIKEKYLNRSKVNTIFSIADKYYYTDDYQEDYAQNYVLEKLFILKKNFNGKENEMSFMRYIDSKSESIEWWFKNGDSGKEYFGIKYFNTKFEREAIFYPDWIIKFKDGRIGIFDTKKGFTAENTEGRAEALAKKLIELGHNFVGGIVIKEDGIWYYNDSIEYSYSKGKLGSKWNDMENLFTLITPKQIDKKHKIMI